MTVKYSDRDVASAYLELLRAVHVGVSEMGVPMAHQRKIGRSTATTDPGSFPEGINTRLSKSELNFPVESDLFVKQADVILNDLGLTYDGVIDVLTTLGVSSYDIMYAWDVDGHNFYHKNPFDRTGMFQSGAMSGAHRPSNILMGRMGSFRGPNTEEVLAAGGDPRQPGVKLTPMDNPLEGATVSLMDLNMAADTSKVPMPHEGKFDHLLPLVPNSAIEWGLELGIGAMLGPAGRQAMGKAITSFTRWLNPSKRLKRNQLTLLPDGSISRSTPRVAGPDQGPNPISTIRRPDDSATRTREVIEKPDPSDFASVREYEIAVQEYWQRVNPDPGVREFIKLIDEGKGLTDPIPLNRKLNREQWDNELMELEHQINEYENYIAGKTAEHGGMTPKQIREVLDELSQSDLLDDAFYSQNAERVQSLWDRAAPMIDDDPWRDPNTLAEALSLFKQEYKGDPIKGGMGYEFPDKISKEDLLPFMRQAIANRERKALTESPEWGIKQMEEMLEKDSPDAGIQKFLDEINSPPPDEWDEGITGFVKRVGDEMGIPAYDGWDSFMANAADADYQKIKDLGFGEDWLRMNVHNDDQLAQFFELIDMDVNVEQLDQMIADYTAQLSKDPYFGDGLTDEEIIDGLDLSRQPFNQDDEILPDSLSLYDTGDSPQEREALEKFLRARKYHEDPKIKPTATPDLPLGGPGKGKLFDQDSIYVQENTRKLYGWLLAGAGGAAVTTWLATNPDHASKLIDFASKLGDVIGRGARGTGHQSIDSLNPGIANQIFGMNSALAGSTIISGAEDPSLYKNAVGDLRKQGINPQTVIPKDVQTQLENGDAVFVGYETMKDQEEAIRLAPQFGVEVSSDLPHIWRKPNRNTIRPSNGEEWDPDRLKKFAMQQMFYPDAGLRRRT